jgi:hypothetical protein
MWSTEKRKEGRVGRGFLVRLGKTAVLTVSFRQLTATKTSGERNDNSSPDPTNRTKAACHCQPLLQIHFSFGSLVLQFVTSCGCLYFSISKLNSYFYDSCSFKSLVDVGQLLTASPHDTERPTTTRHTLCWLYTQKMILKSRRSYQVTAEG